MQDLKGKTALVTGASSGLGVAFAKLLGARGADLFITARRLERLEALAQELSRQHGITVTPIALDLGQPGGAAALFEKTEGAGAKIDILINNAGFGTQERFTDTPWERTKQMLQLNIGSVTELTWRFARAMLSRKSGHILNVASIGAYLPSPYYAAYSASKAFVRDFTEAVAYELTGSGVFVCSLCPGLTTTEFHLVAGHKLPSHLKAMSMSAEQCAEIGLRALFAGRRNIVSGFANAVQMFLLRFMPRRAMAVLAAAMVGKKPSERPSQLPG